MITFFVIHTCAIGLNNLLLTTVFLYHRAVEARQFEIVKLILNTSTGKKTLSFQMTNKATALMIACQKGFPEIVKFIMEMSDTDLSLVDNKRKNVFHYAAQNDAILPVMIDICQRKVRNN